MGKDPRSKYWDEDYYKYWKARVIESNSEDSVNSLIVSNDTVVPSDKVIKEILKKHLKSESKDSRLLDVGCGWGRMFRYYSDSNYIVYGVDISQKMVEEAISMNIAKDVQVAVAEKLPYEDNFFNCVVCLGVFDATFQNKAVSEFMRVLKIGGKAIVTGKNKHYYTDDREAYLAEAGARRKGEPNYFTDFEKFMMFLEESGHEIIDVLYFERRGDYSVGRYTRNKPNRFYEYFIVFQKRNNKILFEEFSSLYSDSFMEIEKNEN